MEKPPRGLPRIHIPTVHHVGTLDVERRGGYSLEGPALSVTTHPEAWTRIARLGGSPTHTLKGGVFLNAHRLSSQQWNSVMDWGVRAGHVEPVDKWLLRGEDEEIGEYYSEFDSREEALYEASGDSSLVSPHSTVSPVNTSDARGMPGPDYSLLHAAKSLDKRGVWWTDRLEPYRDTGSAPRGALLDW